ncbi:MAG: hypothetical protein ACTSUX_02510 [Promethearchaeota archaeon]
MKLNEKNLIKFAREGWSKAIQAYYFPPLDEPRYVFDYSLAEGFYIDPNANWRVTMNLASAPPFSHQDDYINFFHAISMHEIGHYQIIPYDGLIHAKLLKAAIKHLSPDLAQISVNLFADIVIDTILYREHPFLMKWEIEAYFSHLIYKNDKNFSNFSKLIFYIYKKMFQIKVDIDDIKEDIKDLGDNILEITLKNLEIESTWEQKVSKISKLLKELIKKEFTIVVEKTKCNECKAVRKSPNNKNTFIEFSEDILEIMGNPLEIKNKDVLEIEKADKKAQKAEDFAKDCSYSNFGAPARIAGIIEDLNPLATWYRGKAKDLIQIRFYEEKPSGLLPVYPEMWRIGDPVSDMDITQSVITFPVIIPNVITKKWKKDEQKGLNLNPSLPDLLIIIDSSGSMDWDYKSNKPKGKYHVAVLSSFAVLNHAIKKGVKVSVINFSDRALVCDWTANVSNAENVILKYQGGGTVLPIKVLLKQCQKAENNVLVFLITDFELYNWKAARKKLIQVAEWGHKIIGFFIGSKSIEENWVHELQERIKLYPIKNLEDLINLIISEVKKYY